MIWVSPFLCKLFSVVVSVEAITLWPFIICRTAPSPVTVNHERIHLAQQKELWVLGFYWIYVSAWIKRTRSGTSGEDAYMQDVFEKEAYEHEKDLSYLKTRKPFAWKT